MWQANDLPPRAARRSVTPLALLALLICTDADAFSLTGPSEGGGSPISAMLPQPPPDSGTAPEPATEPPPAAPGSFPFPDSAAPVPPPSAAQPPPAGGSPRAQERTVAVEVEPEAGSAQSEFAPWPSLDAHQRALFETLKRNEMRRLELDSQIRVMELEKKLGITGGEKGKNGDAERHGAAAPGFALLSTFGTGPGDRAAVVSIRGAGKVTVRGGDRLPGGWRVKRVEEYQVVVERDGERMEIVLGAPI